MPEGATKVVWVAERVEVRRECFMTLKDPEAGSEAQGIAHSAFVSSIPENIHLRHDASPDAEMKAILLPGTQVDLGEKKGEYVHITAVLRRP